MCARRWVFISFARALAGTQSQTSPELMKACWLYAAVVLGLLPNPIWLFSSLPLHWLTCRGRRYFAQESTHTAQAP